MNHLHLKPFSRTFELRAQLRLLATVFVSYQRLLERQNCH